MYTLLAILIALASLLLIGAVLIQKSKGGGLAQNVGGYNQYMGVRKTTEFIEKVTWGLAIFICVLSIATAFLGSSTTATADQPQIKELNLPAMPFMIAAQPDRYKAMDAIMAGISIGMLVVRYCMVATPESII